MSLTRYTKENPLVETFEFVPSRVLTEDVDPNLVLTEDARPIKRTVIEGVFQRADTPNKNKRIYPRGIWEKLCDEKSDMMRRVRERSMIGHVEHPSSGTTDLNQAAILITDVKLKENGEVFGRAIVYNTPAGRIVQEMIDTGTKYGISSRGTGSVDSKGVVQEDYNCDTWDIVFNPSTPGAFPKLSTEKADEQKESTVKVEETTKPSVNEAAASIEQILLQTGGPEWVAKKTGLTGNNLAMIFGRFLSFVQQRGAAFHELEPLWGEFEKFYPQVKDIKNDAGGDHGAPPSKPATSHEVPPNPVPAATTIAKESTEAPAAGDAPKKDDEKTKIKLDEEGAALLAEAKATVTRLEGEVASLTEKNKTVSVELESSKATIASLTEAQTRLQSEVDAYVSTLGALTAVNVAAQVREATESAVRADSRLAAFRDVLEAQSSPAAVEAKSKKLVEALQETAKKTEAPKANSLEERIRARRTVAENSGLPTGSVASDADAEKLSESAADKPQPNKRAGVIVRAIQGIAK